MSCACKPRCSLSVYIPFPLLFLDCTMTKATAVLVIGGLLCTLGYIVIWTSNQSDEWHGIAPMRVQSLHHRIPVRLRDLIAQHKVIGENLKYLSDGTETVEEIMIIDSVHKEPMTITEITTFLSSFLHTLHDTCAAIKKATHKEIWQAYHDLAVKVLYPWDREYLTRMPKRRDDGTIFLSVASYRDENCPNTLKWAFEKAKYPEKIFVGLVQQNCYDHCRSGVLEGGRVEDVAPDIDCYKEFCDAHPEYCNQIRILHVNESESLGPYAARFFASKLWGGEPWYMQVDAHMTFAKDWDADSIKMLQNAPTKKPVISHYPPEHTFDLDNNKHLPGSRLCGGVFANTDLESQIIRLEGSIGEDNNKLATPRFSGFTAAGYFVAHSGKNSEELNSRSRIFARTYDFSPYYSNWTRFPKRSTVRPVFTMDLYGRRSNYVRSAMDIRL